MARWQLIPYKVYIIPLKSNNTLKENPNMSILNYLALLLTPLFFLIQVQGCLAGACPSIEAVQQALKKTFPKEISVIKVQPGIFPGLCDIQVKFKGQNRMLYTDSKGEFLITGQIYRTSDGTNLTKEVISNLNRFTDSDLKRLEELTAFTVNSKGKPVYLVTDPHCSYCKKAEAIVKRLAETGEIQLKVLLFPLSFHKGAKEQCISIICDNKGMDGLHSQYKSENQCQDGTKKVEDTISFMQQKGITGVPTFIFSDGKYNSGVLKEEVLRERLGLPKGETAQKEQE